MAPFSIQLLEFLSHIVRRDLPGALARVHAGSCGHLHENTWLGGCEAKFSYRCSCDCGPVDADTVPIH